MRKALMETFDEIYILDLHGDTRKKETAFDGDKDENVFDIMQGVSINIFIKKKQSVILSEARKGEVEGSLARVYHYELFGKRFEKYAFLARTSFSDIPWNELTPQAPQYFFVPKDFSVRVEYEKGFKVDELMNTNAIGLKSQNDDACIAFSSSECEILKNDFLNLSISEIERKYGFKNSRDWKIALAKDDLRNNPIRANKISYRPFDIRSILYTGKTKGIVGYPRDNIMRHLLHENVAMVVSRQCISDWKYVFCSKMIGEHNLIASAGKFGAGNYFPLYLYPTEGEEKLGETRKPNLDEKIWRKIDKCTKHKTTPEQVFDYIYGVLHTPSYREKYKEFLKIDFPRIPYPENKEEFERIASIGNKLRKLHLMEEIPPQATSFDIEGDNAVSEIRFEREIPDQVGDDNYGKVFINKTQYFGNVPELAWNFYIGGYQPAQKWLKDRKNRTLTYDDISHYRKIIAILIETHKLMQNLDEIAG
jgi:predicted helicase